MRRAFVVLRAAFIVVWIGVIVACFAAYLSAPEAFTADRIAAFLRDFRGEIWLLYLAMSSLRGFTLLHSTPFVLAGTVLFPEQPVAVLAASLLGIFISSSLIYFFSGALGFSDYFEKRGSRLASEIRAKLERPAGAFFVALWAFFPAVPTDVVCYVAGSIRMSFSRFILAVLAGEMILCSVYVFIGTSVWELFA
jgi:uncharacterized membrane protein YdjX (TVP38/TMEM64 family)